MKPLSEVLHSWTPPSGATGKNDPLVAVSAHWEDVVGSEVARNASPSRFGDETLTVATRSSAWSHQLSFLAEEILAALRARLPNLHVRALRFRVGRIAGPRPAPPAADAPRRSIGKSSRVAAASSEEALERWRGDVTATRRAKQAAGWKECAGCAALVSPGAAALCIVCEIAREQRRADEVERLLFDAPWLGYAGTAAAVSGLSIEEYESIRARILTRWWELLSRAKTAKRLSSDRRERSIASSYVVLRSKLPPEEIAPATVRNLLGDELHDLIYGMERNETNVE
ncbi:MAG: DUF721 domain-containing protein [Candidatus Eremiobacteraeota bacterium]|nr:DUF721 domain-containing protein [Candidatus Eremiobacteraeota bacterium]MBV8332816.1 DUF721 domain-containing protein [Candidatus Eremiobacteraeota bacterium]MBV8434376.1 DUF721 domain-containing protein [Candidatus Eremiobacteraeota bacterium]MBV8720801.1 DUF721 domain-containing protein [Candidatus Eremiobacteraeota bacterium]